MPLHQPHLTTNDFSEHQNDARNSLWDGEGQINVKLLVLRRQQWTEQVNFVSLDKTGRTKRLSKATRKRPVLPARFRQI